MTQRVAGGQHDDAQVLGARRGDPARHFAERAVHVPAHGTRRQVGGDEFERTRGADHQVGGQETRSRAIGQSGPAVVEDANQGALLSGFHLLRPEQ